MQLVCAARSAVLLHLQDCEKGQMSAFYFGHIFVWRYCDIQIVALVIGLLWVGWMIYGIGYSRGHDKGYDKGNQNGYDFGFKAAARKAGVHPKSLED